MLSKNMDDSLEEDLIMEQIEEPCIESPLGKFLKAFNDTIEKVIERVGHRI